jgi:hypothetical protein
VRSNSFPFQKVHLNISLNFLFKRILNQNNLFDKEERENREKREKRDTEREENIER